MKLYAARRILIAIPVTLVVTLISYCIMELIPGDPAALIAGSEATNAEIQQLRVQLGLNLPFHVRLLHWYGGLLHGDLGQSILLQKPVFGAIIERLPITLELACYALALAIAFGVPLGIVAAVNRGGWVDQLCTCFSLTGVSVPNFWLGLIFIFAFASGLGWFPTGGYVPFARDPVGCLRSLTLPALTLGLLEMGLLGRITRSSMLEVLGQDYIRTARAKGQTRWKVVLKHALRNVVVPVVTVIGILASSLVSGSVVIETVFSLPGVGRLVIEGIQRRDYPIIQGGLLVTAIFFVLINLMVDLLYHRLDPRLADPAR